MSVTHTFPRTILRDDFPFFKITTTAGQTITITASAAHSALVCFNGSNAARCGMYALVAWAAAADGGTSQAIIPAGSSGVTITKTADGWTIATGTGTRYFSIIVMSGEIDSVSVA